MSYRRPVYMDKYVKLRLEKREKRLKETEDQNVEDENNMDDNIPITFRFDPNLSRDEYIGLYNDKKDEMGWPIHKILEWGYPPLPEQHNWVDAWEFDIDLDHYGEDKPNLAVGQLKRDEQVEYFLPLDRKGAKIVYGDYFSGLSLPLIALSQEYVEGEVCHAFRSDIRSCANIFAKDHLCPVYDFSHDVANAINELNKKGINLDTRLNKTIGPKSVIALPKVDIFFSRLHALNHENSTKNIYMSKYPFYKYAIDGIIKSRPILFVLENSGELLKNCDSMKHSLAVIRKRIAEKLTPLGYNHIFSLSQSYNYGSNIQKRRLFLIGTNDSLIFAKLNAIGKTKLDYNDMAYGIRRGLFGKSVQPKAIVDLLEPYLGQMDFSQKPHIYKTFLYEYVNPGKPMLFINKGTKMPLVFVSNILDGDFFDGVIKKLDEKSQLNKVTFTKNLQFVWIQYANNLSKYKEGQWANLIASISQAPIKLIFDLYGIKCDKFELEDNQIQYLQLLSENTSAQHYNSIFRLMSN